MMTYGRKKAMIHLVKALSQGGESWPNRPLRRELDMESVPFVCILSKINIPKSSGRANFFVDILIGFFKSIPNFFHRIFKTAIA